MFNNLIKIVFIFYWSILTTAFSQEICLMPPAGPPGIFNKELSQSYQNLLNLPLEKSEPDELLEPAQVTGAWKALIILIDFPDYRWFHQNDSNFPNSDSLYTPEHFDQMLFSLSTYRHPGSLSVYTGSMRDFYLENSYGQFDITGVVTRWYTAPESLAFYVNRDKMSGTADDYGFGAYPNNVKRLVEEAIELADADVDFSQFDNNQDGVVDALFVVHAGPGAEEIYTKNFPAHFNYLWSHKSSIKPQTRDGVLISGYTLEPENGTIGVFCHEFGHALGLPDLYDTDGSSEGIGEWGLMSSGGWCHRKGDPLGTSPSHFTAWSKAKLGWLTPINLTTNLTGVVIPPVETNPVAYRLWRNGEITTEYFMIENRQNLGFDQGLTRRQKDFDQPDPSGLIIYHIDATGHQNDELHRRIDVEEATPYMDSLKIVEQLDLRRNIPMHQFLFNGNRGDNGDPFPGFSSISFDARSFTGDRTRDAFNDESIPNSRDNQGVPTFVAIENIKIADKNIIADLKVTNVTSIEPVPVSELKLPETYQLLQNFPNPFNPRTQISFEVPITSRIQIRIFNTKGTLVKTLLDTERAPGFYSEIWDGKDEEGHPVASGVYIYQLHAGNITLVRNMLLIR